MEIELKLLIDRTDVQTFKKHALLKKYAQSAPVEQDQADIYFDTVDHDFKHADAGLRVRQVGKACMQTFKAGGATSGGLHQRHEWEAIVPGPEPDLYVLKKLIDQKGAWSDLIKSPKIAARLRPIFTTKVRRTIWQLQTPEGCEIECVLDEGNIVCGDRHDPISEIELELKSGDPLCLFDIALELLNKVPMHIGTRSKAERGYALHGEETVLAVKAKSLVLSKKMTIEQAFEAIVNNCLQQIQANQTGVALANHIDSLHQMRIGLRRLRSALGLFQEIITVPEDLQQDLDWLSDEISAARDWDVLATKTLESIEIEGESADLEKVKRAALARAAQLHNDSAAIVSSVRYTRFVLSFVKWVQGREWRDSLLRLKDKDLKKQLKIFSTNMLKNDKKRLSKRGQKLETADSHARHRVRIAAKKMRYDTEFFQSLYSSKETKKYVTSLSKLQDKLGWLNDIAVGEKLLTELQNEQSELTDISGFIRGYLAARATVDEKEVKKLWKKYKSRTLPK